MDIKTLYKLSYGLYIVSSKKNGKLNGQIVNSAFQVTAEPPQIAVCINKQNLTHEFIDSSSIFTVSVITTKATLPFIGSFGFKSGRNVDKFKDVKYRLGKTGAPLVLENTNGVLECEVVGRTDAGTHTIFIGRLIEAEILNDDEAMTYDHYHRELKGKAPKTAATYIKEAQTKGAAAKNAAKYKCRICGYVYDPEKGDPDAGVKPGTPFEALPGNWVCPVCGAGKEKFERMP